MPRFFPMLVLIVLLSGCSVAMQKNEQQTAVEKNAPVVYVYPLSEFDLTSKTVAVLAFQTPDNVDPQVGAGVAGLFRDVFLGKRAFKGVMLLEQNFFSQQQAAEIGRKAGVDLVVAGRVNYQLAGYELGGDRLDVSMRLLDARSGETLWFIGQSMNKPMTYPERGFWTRLRTAVNQPQTRSQSKEPEVSNMLVRIAEDMSEVLAGATTVSKL